jgi:hypothetical protein
VPITTEVMSSNPAHGELYSIYYVMKFVSDLRNVGGFLCVTEILLKVSLNKLTVTQTHTYDLFFSNNNPDTKQESNCHTIVTRTFPHIYDDGTLL